MQDGRVRNKATLRSGISANVPLRAPGRLASLAELQNESSIPMPTQTREKANLSWLLGTTMSVLIAAALIFLVRGTHRSVLVPIVFIVVIVLCARYFGVIAGILGSVVATGMFAVFLFKPYGSFRVADHQALLNLGLLLFAGIALSYANADDDDNVPRPLKPR